MVNNITSDFDFNSMREAFRALDSGNTGVISIEQLKKGFSHDNHITYVDTDLLHSLFSRLDFNNNGSLNYSEFLAATVDKKMAITKDNL